MSDDVPGFIPPAPATLTLSNGAEILVAPAPAITYAPLPGGGLAAYTPPPIPYLGGGAVPAGANLPFESVAKVITGVMQDIGDAVKAASPDKFSVEVGLEIKAQSGPVLSVILAGGGSASITVTMEWEKDAPETPAAPTPAKKRKA